jgi:hypothetical protein
MLAEFTDIEKQLMERITESRLRDSLALIRNAVEDIWADDAPRIIQDYTDHGIHHSERLVDYAAQSLAANDGRPLSAEETYLLLAGIYLHDIGMQCDVVKYPEIKAKAEAMGAKFDVEFSAKTASSYTIDEQKAIRKNHHLLTSALIDYARRTGETVLGPAIRTVPDELVGDLIDVCKYHAKLPISECPITFTLDERGRKQLVAALIRFADELDVDGHRVSIETVKSFRLDPRNAVYWWLHQLTKVVIAGNVITLTTRLCPDDEQPHGSLVREAFIEEFRTKNRPVLSVLRQNNIPIAISADSGVVAYEYADPLPDDIVQALQLMQEKKGVLDELAGEVKTWLEAIGYEVSEPTGEGRTRDMVATLQRGLMRQQVLVRCFEGEIAQADLEALEAEPSLQKWGISEMRVAPSAREYAEAQSSVQVFNLADFMRLIWGPYFDYLTGLVEESDIPRYYVDLGCHKKEIDGEGREVARDTYAVIDNYIDDWLSERGRLHISILGEFGAGKTWFCRHYAYRQLKCYLDDPIKERLPLLITLRAFTKATTAQQLINDALLEQYKLPFVGSAFDIFQEMNRRGKLLLILDGFDEMARKVEYQTVVDNFWELAQVVVEGSKLLLTSRTEYFRWAKESEKVLGGEELGRKMIRIEPPKFEVLHLEPFSDEQIEEVVVKRVGPENGPVVARRILDTSNLAELARKPVLIELLLAALPEIEAREEVNEAQVYLYATNELLLRNITAERTFTTTADKLFFLCELAWEMICSGELRIHYTDIPERIQAWFGDHIKDKPELDHWDYDLRNQTLLQRNAAGYYEFAHKSLAEYFVAYKFTAELDCLVPEFRQTYCEADGTPCKLPIAQKDLVELVKTFGTAPLTKEVQDFMLGMVTDSEPLWVVIEKTKGKTFEDVRYLGGNAATVLNRFDRTCFAGRDLAATVLAGADFDVTDFTGASLSNASLIGAKFTDATLVNTNLFGASLVNAVFMERGGMLRVSFSPDGERLAVVGRDCYVHIWDTSSWAETNRWFAHQCLLIGAVAWSPDSKWLATVDYDGLVKIWELGQGVSIAVLDGHQGSQLYCVDFDALGRHLISAGYRPSVKIWNISKKEPIKEISLGGEAWYARYTMESQVLAIGMMDGRAILIDVQSGKTNLEVSIGDFPVRGVLTLSERGWLIAAGGLFGRETDPQGIYVFDLATGEQLFELEGHQCSVTCLARNPNSSCIIASGSEDKTIAIWNVETRRLLKVLKGHDVGLDGIDFSPNGCLLASVYDDATIRIWDVDLESATFGECLKVLGVRMNCRGMRIGGAKGLEQKGYGKGGEQTLEEFLRERGAVD